MVFITLYNALFLKLKINFAPYTKYTSIAPQNFFSLAPPGEIPTFIYRRPACDDGSRGHPKINARRQNVNVIDTERCLHLSHDECIVCCTAVLLVLARRKDMHQ